MAKKYDFSSMHLSDIPGFIGAAVTGKLGDTGEMMTTQTGFYEINLVPDIKSEMIKTQKIRNIVFFVCIIIVLIAGASVGVLASIKGAQDITMASQDGHLKKLSDKVMSYSDLTEFLTIQNQLNGIASVEDQLKVMPRSVLYLKSLIPNGPDTVQVSELSISLDESTLSFDAQANAGTEPDIDYRVLESFIKRANLMTFDYGRYVDDKGNEIPTRCIVEYDSNNKMFQENGSIYAIWTRGRKGCDPGRDDYEVIEGQKISFMNATIESTNVLSNESILKIKKNDAGEDVSILEYTPSEKIYRTPQFTNWYKGVEQSTAKDGIEDDVKVIPPTSSTLVNITYYRYTPEMSLSGSISGVPHFESQCITYSGTEEESDGEVKIKWSASNECMLIPDGITVNDSSNGRDADENLVLRFSAVVKLNEDALKYRNKHVMAIGPNGQNVTDSYVQLNKIFTQPARACSANDTTCNNTPTKGDK